jgi:hypothetical protein
MGHVSCFTHVNLGCILFVSACSAIMSSTYICRVAHAEYHVQVVVLITLERAIGHYDLRPAGLSYVDLMVPYPGALDHCPGAIFGALNLDVGS